MSEIRSYRDLLAWQKSLLLAAEVYKWATHLPNWERYGLASQIQRASCSVPLNIAEGFGTGTTASFLRHLRIARGSLCEVQTCIDLGVLLHALQLPADFAALASEVARLLQGLILSLERRMRPSDQPP